MINRFIYIYKSYLTFEILTEIESNDFRHTSIVMQSINIKHLQKVVTVMYICPLPRLYRAGVSLQL